jgi:crotonobetainyl-CoA:carnitine CoA-transferase CaiB-like acyl-CoA transferase
MSAAPLLHGLRVIDAASYIAGPVATTILADLGAKVIKVEGYTDAQIEALLGAAVVVQPK